MLRLDDGLNCADVASATLEGDEVHVLSGSLDQPAGRVEALAALLCPDERERAARFHFARHRDRFIAARGLLRCVLAAYLGQAPERIALRLGSRGKPALAPQFASARLHFNVSHSQGLALIALARGREVGVDVEFMKPMAEAEQIAERFFSPREVKTLLALPEAERPAAFFACWTRKEAYIKATGEGLARSLDSFDVSFGAGRPARLERVLDDPLEAARWSLVELDPAPGYAAALAVAGPLGRLSCRVWAPADADPNRQRSAVAGRGKALEVR
jgi:4'-phosphopantetheinyl transferase